VRRKARIEHAPLYQKGRLSASRAGDEAIGKASAHKFTRANDFRRLAALLRDFFSDLDFQVSRV
jgi:hypothetical protein